MSDPAARLYQQLATGLAHDRFGAIVCDADGAVRFFVDLAHSGACPRCRSSRWTPTGRHHIDCATCGEVSVYTGTALGRRRLRLHPLLAAIHAMFVDRATPSARGFSRTWGQRLDTTWNLLHELRDALPPTPLPEAGQFFPLLGNESERNRAGVVLGVVDGVVAAAAVVFEEEQEEVEAVVVRVDDIPNFPAVISVWWGLLRAWMTTTFRGVSVRHLARYLREWSCRCGRVARAGVVDDTTECNFAAS